MDRQDHCRQATAIADVLCKDPGAADDAVSKWIERPRNKAIYKALFANPLPDYQDAGLINVLIWSALLQPDDKWAGLCRFDLDAVYHR